MGRKKRDTKTGQRKGNKHKPPAAPPPREIASRTEPPALIDSKTEPAKADSGTESNTEQNTDAQSQVAAVSRYALGSFVVSAVILFATVAQAVFDGCQWDVMNRSLEQTNIVIDQMRFEQRPWLVSRQPVLARPIAENELLELTMPLASCGNTPAIMKHAVIGIWEKKDTSVNLDSDFQRLWRKAKASTEEIVVGPNSNYDGLVGREANYFVDTDKMKLINIDAFVLFASVVCEYTGVDGGIYATEACYHYDRTRGQFLIHNKHNRIDVPPQERGEQSVHNSPPSSE